MGRSQGVDNVHRYKLDGSGQFNPEPVVEVNVDIVSFRSFQHLDYGVGRHGVSEEFGLISGLHEVQTFTDGARNGLVATLGNSPKDWYFIASALFVKTL